MATVNISELYGKTIVWTATLSNSYNTNYYQGVGVTTTAFTDGVYSISGSIAYNEAPTSRTSKTTPTYTNTLNVSSGQNTLYFYSKSKSGQYWNIESKTHSFTSASVTISSIGHDSVTFRISYESAMKYKRFVYKKGTSGTPVYLPSSTTWNSSSSAYTATISGLEPNTRYYYNGVVSRSSTQSNANSINIYESNTKYFTTTSAPTPTTTFSLSVPSGYSDRFTMSVTRDTNFRYQQIAYRVQGTSTWSYTPSTPSSWTSRTVTGLQSGTIYEVRLYVSETASSTQILINSTPETIKTNLRAESTGATEISITGQLLRMYSVNYARVVSLDAYLSTDTSHSNKIATGSKSVASGGTSATGIVIDGLTPNTSYDIECWVELKNTSPSTYTQVLGFTASTSALSGTISYVSSTSTTITAKVTGLSTNSDKSRIVSLDAYLNGVIVPGANGSAPISSTASQTGNIVIPNLSPGKTYTIKGYVSFDGGSTYHYLGSNKDITASTTGVSIALWDWDSANATANPNPATQAQTQAARNACRDKTAISNFKWQVWNDLVYKVSEARVAGGDSAGWNNYYATRAKTLMSDTDKTLTAVRYNSLRYNIGTVYSVPDSKKIYEVSKGDEVNGTTHFLNFVTNYLNAYITQLRGGN